MRGWFVAFLLLLVLLPLQLSWVGLDVPSPLGSEPIAVMHGDHVHAKAGALNTEAGADHTGCGTCHGGCAMALPDEPPHRLATPPAFPFAAAAPLPASRTADLPDRPQWTAPGLTPAPV